MASLSYLSDEELRCKLKEYGIKTPVTNSTRSILLKKLNHLMFTNKNEQSSPKNVHNANSFIQLREGRKEIFGEDDTPVRISPRSRPSNRRNSMKVKSRSTEASSLSFGKLSSFSSDEEAEDEPVQGTQPRRSLRNISHEVSYDSPDMNNSISSRFSPFHKKFPVLKKRTGGHSPSSCNIRLSPRPNNTDKFHYDTGSDSDLCDEIDVGKPENTLYLNDNFSLRPESIISNDVTRRTVNDLASYSPQSRISSNSRLRNDHNGLELRSNIDVSYGDKAAGEITSPDDIISQEPMSATSQLANGQSSFDRVRKLTLEHCTLDREFWIPSIPILLVVLLLLFFCFLGLCYLSIHTPLAPSAWLSSLNIFKSNYPKLGTDNLEDNKEHQQTLPISVNEDNADSKNKFPICSNESNLLLECLSRKEMYSVTDILGLLENIISPALSQRAEAYQCGSAPHHHLTIEEIEKLIYEELPLKPAEETRLGLNGLGKLTLINPHWGIKAAWEKIQNSSNLVGFGTSSYPMEIFCHITSAIYNFVYGLLALLVGFVAAWIAFQGFRFHRKLAEEMEQKSLELVEQILEILENLCGTGGKDFIAVNHVRDCLIPPRERKVKEAIWDKAVQFIADHDSRVYREIRSVGGEDCGVWRWVSGAPRSPISCSNSTSPVSDVNQPPQKIWQGQAFENLERTQNLPQVSPTSCLKIRNMFDAEIEFEDNWPSRIQDSLLEKCEGIAISHVAVDRVSKEGCVYVKCISAAEAGKAFRALHGWWFDGNLVTVKYLREERYFERFPTARIATTPLIPSNNKRLSLQLYPSLDNFSESATNSTTKRGAHSRSHFGAS